MILTIDSLLKKDYDTLFLQLRNQLKMNKYETTFEFIYNNSTNNMIVKTRINKLKHIPFYEVYCFLYSNDYFLLYEYDRILLHSKMDKDKIKMLKKFNEFNFIRNIKNENEEFIDYQLEVQDKQEPTFKKNKNVICCICLESNKRVLTNFPFNCSHNELCFDCFKKINICPLCRSLKK